MITTVTNGAYKPSSDKKLNEPSKVLAECESIRELNQEHFVIFTCDARTYMIDSHTVTIGTASSSPAHPREIFRLAINDNASTVIIAHNHPSGDYTPSQTDKEVTKRIVEAGRIIGIEVVDHVIVSKEGYYSMREELDCLFN